jgi:hypothetical protein
MWTRRSENAAGRAWQEYGVARRLKHVGGGNQACHQLDKNSADDNSAMFLTLFSCHHPSVTIFSVDEIVELAQTLALQRHS